MPEGPEVEIVINDLNNSWIINSTISEIIVNRPKIIKEIKIFDFKEKVKNQIITKVEKKGKWIFFFLQNFVLINHLRMTGKFCFNKKEKQASLIINFSNNKQFFYYDTRGFGIFYLQPINLFKNLIPYKKIGPDIIKNKVSSKYLLFYFSSLKIPIKLTLLNQEIISGIGNIYVSEILFAAKINPLRPTKEITKKEIKKIIYFSKQILFESIKNGGTSIIDFISPYNVKGKYQNKLKVFKRENKPCFECNNKICVKKISGRNTFYCINCQK